MNHSQLIRVAAIRLLNDQGLLCSPDVTTLASSTDRVLTARGWPLVVKLADRLKIKLNPVSRTSPTLQGSLSTFTPYNLSTTAGVLSYNSELDERDRTFAVAHELGHFILHREQVFCHRQDLQYTALDEVPLAGTVEVYNPHNLREREANLFAAELLMPQSELRAGYLDRMRALSMAGYGHGDAVDTLAAHFGVKRHRVLIQLLTVFLASPLPASGLNDLDTAPPLEVGPPNEAGTTNQGTPALDDDQIKAVRAGMPTLVLAGPGAGKTMTLVERVRYLITEGGLSPAHLLVLTFSNKAAGELRARIARAGLPAAQMHISTFHAYGIDFLRRYYKLADLPPDFRLLDRAGSYLLLEDLLALLPGGFYIRDTNPTGYFKELLDDISRTKDYLHTPDEYDAAVAEMRERQAGDTPLYQVREVQRAQERAAIFRIYETEKRSRRQVDFSDLIMLPVQLMQQYPELLAEERERYGAVLIDEFQDINYASGALIRLLTSPQEGGSGQLWAVGDIHQSIYRFRGAFPHQAGPSQFGVDYAGGEIAPAVYELGFNYRSLPPIVSLATALRAEMPEGGVGPTTATRGGATEAPVLNDLAGLSSTPHLYYTEFATTQMEIEALINTIREQCAAGYRYYDQAILCQRHAQADLLARALTTAGIPVTRVSAFFSRAEIQELLAVVRTMVRPMPLALFRLSGGRISIQSLAHLVAGGSLVSREALERSGVVPRLVPPAAFEARRLAALSESLASWRNIWRLMTEYLFNWSTLVIDLTERARDSTDATEARQSLRALGQMIRLAYGFDQAEEAELVRRAAQERGRELTPDEITSIRASLEPVAHRRNFVRYLYALLHSETRIELEAEIDGVMPTTVVLREAVSSREPPAKVGDNADAVHILTAHASKGLEFPVVYLPGLHESRPPWNPIEPPPPDFHYISREGRTDDERCLFYVAVTRARDRLFLSWARHLNVGEETAATMAGEEAESNKPGQQRARSPHPVLATALQFRMTQPDLWGEVATMRESVPTLAPTGLDREEGNSRSPVESVPMSDADAVFDFWDLQRYEECSLRSHYEQIQRGTNVHSESQSRFYNGLKQAQTALHSAMAANGELPELSELLVVYETSWSSDAAAAVLDGMPPDYYHQQGVRIIQALWQHYSQLLEQDIADREFERPIAVTFKQEYLITLQTCQVMVTVDRVETLPDGRKRLVCTRVGQIPEGDDFKQSVNRLLTLYGLALEQEPPGSVVVYEAVSASGVTHRITEKFHKGAINYRRWQRGELKSRGVLAGLEQIAAQIRTGRYEPHPGEHCLRCPFYTLLCPAQLD